MKEKLTDKEIREAAEKEKQKRAEQTMKDINTLLKERNCSIVVQASFTGPKFDKFDYTIIAH